MQQESQPNPLRTAQEKLEGSDKVEVTAHVVQGAVGVAAGLAVADVVAKMAGVATVMGSAKLATLLGGAFAVTPVGWVVGSGVVAGAIAVGLGAALTNGAKNTERRKRLIKELNDLDARAHEAIQPNAIETVRERLQRAVNAGVLDESLADRMMRLVEQGKLKVSVAMLRIDDLLKESAQSDSPLPSVAEPTRPQADAMDVLQESPELMVSALLERLHNLRSAITFLNDNDLIERLVTITRRLTLTNVLSQQPVIAVAGSQGAGKTTLVKSLYGLDDKWLSGNEGRGERSPLLIVESPDVTDPVATVVEQAHIEEDGQKCYLQREVQVSAEEFRKALQGDRPGQLFPKLTVPSRYFDGNTCGLLLLPGHEAVTKKNKSWQSLIRQSLVGADMCVIVTDETRLANNEQSKILQDFQGHLQGSCPIVVVTKTEGKSGEQLAELTSAAADVFGLSLEQAHRRVICSTAQIDDAAKWQAKLAEAMQDLTQVQQIFRAKQLNELHDVLTDDLADLLADVDMASREVSLSTAHFGGPVDDILRAFDTGRNRLRRDYLRELKHSLEEYGNAAVQRALHALSEREEGLLNTVQNSWRWMTTTTGERENILPTYVQEAWQTPWKLDKAVTRNFGHQHQKALGKTTMDILGAPKAAKASYKIDQHSSEGALGYCGTGRTPLIWRSPTQRHQVDLASLFAPKGGKVELSPELLDAVQLLPAFALEYMRISAFYPSLLGLSHRGLAFSVSDTDDIDEPALVTVLGYQGLAILTVIGTMVGAQAALDLVNELAPEEAVSSAADASALVGNLTALGISQSIAGSMAIMLGAGVLVMNLAKAIQHSEGQARDNVRRMTAAISDAHFAHFSSEFDHVMDRLRERLESTLRTRYRLDDQVVRLDRLKKTYADVQMLSTELRESLARNPSFSLV